MNIQILGTGCPKCRALEANVQAAVKQLNLQATVEKVTDIDEIMQKRVMMTADSVQSMTAVGNGDIDEHYGRKTGQR